MVAPTPNNDNQSNNIIFAAQVHMQEKRGEKEATHQVGGCGLPNGSHEVHSELASEGTKGREGAKRMATTSTTSDRITVAVHIFVILVDCVSNCG